MRAGGGGARTPSLPTPPQGSILHVSQPVSEGVANCVRDLVEHQVDLGLPVAVACPADGWLGPAARAAGAAVHSWPSRRELGGNLVGEWRSLRQIVADVDPAVVHLHSSKAGLIGRLVVRGRRPTVYQPNGWSFLAATGPTALAAQAWESLASRWAASTVVVSEGERWLAPRRGQGLVVVPNTVDLSRIDGAAGGTRADADLARAAVRRSLGVEDEPLVLCVGRLCRQKGQDVLLDAWPRVLAAVPSARLLLVGDGPARDELESRRQGRVEFLGQRSDVAELLHAADLVAMPSRWEGMSYGMLEAMAAGRAVVAAHAPGVWETVGAGAGEVVPLDDPSSLADAMVARLLDPPLARREGERGRAIVEERHQLAEALRAIDAVYQRLVPGGELVPRASEPAASARPLAATPASSSGR